MPADVSAKFGSWSPFRGGFKSPRGPELRSMTLEQFRKSAAAPSASLPAGLAPALLALWLDARGDWAGAHEESQADRTRDGSWVHAYLHRKEGDLGNARYWYSRAGRPAAEGSLEEEWAAIARTLLESRPDAALP